MDKPVFFSLATANGEWTRSLSRKTAQKFDCIVADARDHQSAGESGTDPQAFVDGLLAEAVKRLDMEPIDIYSHATYLPPAMSADRDKLWTEARTAKLIDALLRNKVAIELNTTDQLPKQEFIQQAKDAGCKFGFGTGNASASELKRCEYGLEMVRACHLDWQNFYAPGSWQPKAADRRWPLAT